MATPTGFEPSEGPRDAAGVPGGTARARWLLAGGAALGIALAVASLLAPTGSDSLPEGAVAKVGEAFVRGQDYERAVAALASDRRSDLTPEDRRFVLDRLIDEELLVQYGLSLGLARSDRRIRSEFVTAVISAQVAAADGTAPTQPEIEEFYRENQSFFRPPSRLQVRNLWVRAEPMRAAPAALARAQQAIAALRAGAAFDGVDAEWGDPQVAPIPDTPLPLAKLREYIGPTALSIAQNLEVGGVSEPIESDGGVRVVQLVASDVPEAEPLADVAQEVRSEMVRRSGDDALRRLLAELRAGTEIAIVEELQ